MFAGISARTERRSKSMYSIVELIQSLEITKAVVQLITGKLLTEEQIRSISKNAVGSYFADWLPTPKEEVEAKKRVEEARMHITEASRIVSTLQDDLDKQFHQLDQIVKDIEAKKNLADHYSKLVEINQQAFSAFKSEIEESIRKELRLEADRGKRARQLVSLAGSVITLVLGAALGAYFIPLVQLIQNWFK
jgi:hypothetical protein